MNNQKSGKDGQPGTYAYQDVPKIELYDLDNDIAETLNVADQFPDIVNQIKEMANEKRTQLGDALYAIEGKETRQPGKVQ